jgi:acetyl-CoA carboxylase biotin carboxyl carrier protein
MEVRAELPGNVWKVLVKSGESVTAGQHLLVMETMKMEIPVTIERDGTVLEVRVTADQQVREGDVLILVEAAS